MSGESKSVYFVGVDVGTGSARAALVTKTGKIICTAVESIQTWNPKSQFYEQSSDNIWEACVKCIKRVVVGTNPDDIKGIGFDATCSLVALDSTGDPVSISPTGENNQNIILWMDHRASNEADHINNLSHPILKYVGGKVSLEMQIPKLLWLKTHLPKQWQKIDTFYDLPDFLTYKSTGSQIRSLCSLVCKWNYEVVHCNTDATCQVGAERQQGWNLEYLSQIGLEELRANNWRKIGNMVQVPGTPLAAGLSKQAAEQLGLRAGTAVGCSLIDAHAGGLGMIGCQVDGAGGEFSERLGLICGTSTCVMAVSNRPVFAGGVWGPYFSAMVPGMWLNEGGQSATGKLIDHVVDNHPAYASLLEKSKEVNSHLHLFLNQLCVDLMEKAKLNSEAYLTKNLHVYPDFHGNRSPIADPTLTGAISGLTLANDEANLALLYLATIQSLAYGTRHIIDTLLKSGHQISSILICGGLSKNELFVKTQADACNLPVICPNEVESVLLGSAILGACAAGVFVDIESAIKSMGGTGCIFYPNQKVQEYHEKKYKVFLKMLKDQQSYNEIMN